MKIFQKSKKLATHNGSFHADDIFACATLMLMLEKKGKSGKVYRTRDEEIIKKADYVFDVGGIYDAEKDRFDHHQIGGAGKRENGIEYSSFGLVWKKFGEEVCGSKEVAEILDNNLAAPVDAFDNGFDLVENKYSVSPYFIQHFFFAMRPVAKEKNIKDNFKLFLKSVKIAKEILLREIAHTKEAVLIEQKITDVYNKTEDKRFLVLNEDFHNEDILSKFKDLLFVVYPRKSDNLWGIRTVKEGSKTFKNRKDFPKAWAGKRNEEMEKVTGVSGAVFCHNGLFLAVAKSKEGAVKLAKLALENKEN